ncbi:hypothetical protein NIES208_11035 [[Limnothrix rosea] IAM M-220]|nr:hypothetical protein NIES208_11035 [[Limnothrix rosea] IAM M-220]
MTIETKEIVFSLLFGVSIKLLKDVHHISSYFDNGHGTFFGENVVFLCTFFTNVKKAFFC